mmetsp:Transcript_9103/g.14113  ORF Transcript_9103/g.14113 Transcript_9103/m.14113 type:complete len:329 (+) Transcript_9103:139-1125(+)
MSAEVAHDPSEFKDEDEEAVPEDAGNFPVTEEELHELREQLKEKFPEDYTYLSSRYMESVASKPYSKNPKIRRPLDYTLSKLEAVMEWRKTAGAPNAESWVDLAFGKPSGTKPDAASVTRANAMVTSLNNGSLYWHGFTKDGHPILWVRTNRKPWFPDVQADLDALMLLADAGVRAMPPTVTSFCVFAESSSPPPPNPSFLIGLLKALVRGYPDRLQLLISAPISSIIQFVMNLLLPLMPGRLSSKVVLADSAGIAAKLSEVLSNGKDGVPTFFGGPANHDELYPEESKSSLKGGTLKFDYYGMVERLETQKQEWMKLNADKISEATG